MIFTEGNQSKTDLALFSSVCPQGSLQLVSPSV